MFTKGVDSIELPIRHGEGKFFAEDGVIQKIRESNQIVFQYSKSDGELANGEYPYNPNGAELNCAGLTDKTGQILGIMPHPEAYLSLYNHPNWGQLKRQNPAISDDGDGLQVFKNIVEHIRQRTK